jgi:hypothetical protein
MVSGKMFATAIRHRLIVVGSWPLIRWEGVRHSFSESYCLSQQLLHGGME